MLNVKNYEEVEKKVLNLTLNLKKAEKELSEFKIKCCENEFLKKFEENVKTVGEF